MSLSTLDHIVAFTANRVDAGPIGGELVQIGSGGLAGDLVQAVTAIDPYDGKNKVYAVDGEGAIVVDIAGETVTGYSNRVSDVGTGSLPAECALIAIYRGRMVLARQPLNPGIWFMSRLADPFDWGYGLDPQSTTPVAGNNTDVGRVADALTCLAPYSDDHMTMGAASSIWLMRGDPAFGGSLDAITYETGILGPRAYCFDEYGNMYFMGQGGLYRMARGDFTIESLLKDRLSQEIGRVDYVAKLVQLIYDPIDFCVHVYLTPQNETDAGLHIVYDIRHDAFWLDRYPLSAGPFAVAKPSAANPQNRRPHLGGLDGHIRRHDTNAKNDADTSADVAIESFVRFAPVEQPGGLATGLLTELHAFGAQSNDPVDWSIYASQSPDEVRLATTATITGSWFPSSDTGFQQPARMRVRGGAVQLEVGSNSVGASWALERINAFMGPVSRRRR